MNARHVQIVVDDTSCLSLADSLDYDIAVVPMPVDSDGGEASTSAIQTLDLAVAYARAQERAGDKGVLVLHVGKTFSSTWSNGVIAGEAVGNIEVIDTGTVGAAVGFAAVAAAKVAEAGGSLRDCAAAAREIIDRSHVWGYVPRLDSLRRGGRISTGKVVLSTALAIKPLIGIEDGSVNLVAKHRTLTKVLEALIERCTAVAGGLPAQCIIMNSGDTDLVETIQEHLEDNLPDGSTIHLTELPPSLLAHTGPEACFVSMIPDERVSLNDAHPDTPSTARTRKPGTPDGGLVYSTSAGGVVLETDTGEADAPADELKVEPIVGEDVAGDVSSVEIADGADANPVEDAAEVADVPADKPAESDVLGAAAARGSEWIRAVSAQIATHSENRRLAKERAEALAEALDEVDGVDTAEVTEKPAGTADTDRPEPKGLLKGFLRRLSQDDQSDNDDTDAPASEDTEK